MNTLYFVIYFTCFALIAGGAFAMMWGNIQSINRDWNKPSKSQHPEAPKAGEEVMYMKVSSMSSTEFQETKNRLEDLFND